MISAGEGRRIRWTACIGGDGYDSFLFAIRDSAEYVAQIRKALYQSKTWGDFKAALPSGEWANLRPQLDDPPDDDPFKADDIGGHADGDSPEWLRQSRLNWLPIGPDREV